MFNFKLSSKKLSFLLTVVAILAMMTMTAYGAETEVYDMTSAITSGIEGLVSQVLGIIAVVVPSILVIVGAKLAITKGIGIFKSLTGKA